MSNAYSHFKIQPDEQLLMEYEASTTGADVHERNRHRGNYMGWAQLGEEKAMKLAETKMRALIVNTTCRVHQ